jgi:hypothetical protein
VRLLGISKKATPTSPPTASIRTKSSKRGSSPTCCRSVFRFRRSRITPTNLEALDYRGLQKFVADTHEALQRVQPAEVNALEGRDVLFQIRDLKLPFTAENFLMSFSLPNFHFHATTAYDILRSKGVPIGKRDYLGQMRMKSA